MITNTKQKILILGLTNKSGLALARALNKVNCTVDAILFNKLAAQYSKFLKRVFLLSDPEKNANRFIDELIQLLDGNNYDALIPVHDGALELCRLRISDIREKVKVVGVNIDESYKYSIDKSELLTLGRNVGLKIPNSFLIKSIEDYKNIEFEGLSFPLVAKPVSSAKIINNKLVWFSVKICSDKTILTDFIRENINSVPILIQEFIMGYGIGYNFISENGNILNDYIHRRVIEINGVSTLRKSFSSNKYNLREKVAELVKRIGWDGIGMVEFKVNKDDHPVLMEFNGRFFGSTELSIRSGINLPVLFHEKFIMNKSIETNLQVKEVTVRFLHDEIIFMGEELFRGKIKKYLNWLMDFFVAIFRRDHFVEDSIFVDPKFCLGLYAYDIKRWHKKIESKIKSKKVKIIALNKDSLVGIKRIIFFCHGNICRSPFAKHAAQKITNGYLFDSAGIVAQERRMPPLAALKAAKKFNIDLNQHNSKSLSSIVIKDSDLFVIMDRKNYLSLKREGIPDSMIRFIGNNDIIDPYGKSTGEFIETYSKIIEELKRIFY